MTKSDQNKVVNLVEELASLEGRLRECRGELIAILQKEDMPAPRPKRKPRIESIEDGIMRRYARKMAKKHQQFSV